MVSPERISALQTGFVGLMDSYSVAPIDAYPVFDRLVQLYSEDHRHYHNLEHLAEMFKVVGKLTDTAHDRRAILLAVWFHDAMYNPRAKDNEAQSAVLAKELLAPLGVPAPTLEHVQQLILATTHQPIPVTDPDAAILLDADLAILAAEEKRYRRYATAIRQEYAWVDDTAYRQGRAGVLQQFLARPRLYHTERLFAVAEEPARVNLLAELQQLQPTVPHG